MFGRVFSSFPEPVKVEGVSNFANELKFYIQKHHEKLGEGQQELLFCTAYSLYSVEKKKHIQSLLTQDNITVDDPAIRSAGAYFSGEDKYKHFCERALEIHTSYINQARTDLLDEVTGAFINIIKDLVNEKAEAGREILKEDLGAIIDEKNKTKPVPIWLKVLSYIWSLFPYALKLGLSGFILIFYAYLLAQAANFAPALDDKANMILDPIKQFWRDDQQPEDNANEQSKSETLSPTNERKNN